MLENPDWVEIIENQYFAKSIWSYRLDPNQLKIEEVEPDWPFCTFKPAIWNESFLTDGINTTIFFNNYYTK